MAAAHRTHFTGISSGDLTGSLKRASLLETLIGPFGWRLFRPTGERTMNGKESPQITKTAYRPDVCTAVTEKKEKLTMKIVLTHTKEFPFDNYEQNLLDDSLYPAIQFPLNFLHLDLKIPVSFDQVGDRFAGV